MMNESQPDVFNLTAFATDLAKSIRDQAHAKLKLDGKEGDSMQSGGYPYIGAFYSQRLGTEFIVEVKSARSLKLDISCYGTWASHSTVRGGFPHFFEQCMAKHLPECTLRLADAVWLTPKKEHAPFFTCTLHLTLRKGIHVVKESTVKPVCGVPQPDTPAAAEHQLGNSTAFV